MASACATRIPPLGVAHARSQLQPLHFARWMPLTAEQRMRKDNAGAGRQSANLGAPPSRRS
ncbi:hypothetical protein XAPC_240 [Xanthomonas citri pv. punicae str. LMG 859]|nr:hypothetical protein XAPC_240 [Xanthomonas citri pv. punicae str. LMG 859]